MMLHRLCLLAALMVSLAACGNDSTGQDFSAPLKPLLARLLAGKSATTIATLDAAGTATLRKALEDDGQPIYLITAPWLKYTNLMAPYGQNRDVQTWASMDYETVALRSGMLVATRGFGSDLVSSSGPGIGQISAARGSTRRSYYLHDGADQTHVFQYDCTLAPAGSDSVTVLGKTYQTRKVNESCSGVSGQFTNEYWFDGRSILRQSRQFMVPGYENMLLQRVID